MLKLVNHFYRVILIASAVVGALILLSIFILIVVDVGVRAIGLQPPNFTVAVAEYGLLYFTMLVAPYLLRTRGHVFVATLRHSVSRKARKWLERLTCVLCTVVTFAFTYFAGELFLQHIASGEVDVRSIDIPRWVGFAALTFGFGLLGVEFLRFTFSDDSLYGEDNITEGI